MLDSYSRPGFRLCFVLLLLPLVSCSRAPITQYLVSQKLSDLPDRHRDQIRGVLDDYFGTPLRPRMAGPAPEDDTPEEETEVTATEDAEPKTKLVELVDRRRLAHGAEIYRNRCAGCHGVSGDGNGEAAAYLQPKPRDYRRGIYKFTSTPYGQKPTRADLVRTIRRGAKGTSMPAFRWLPEHDLQAVIDYIISISQRGETEQFLILMSDEYGEDEDIEEFDIVDAVTTVQERWQPEMLEVVQPVSAPPAYNDQSIVAGRKAFLSLGCSKCHGVDGTGQTEWLSHEFLAQQESLPEDQREQLNYDAWDNPAPAADITARMLHGGRRPLDIYRRIHTGINGTPMPAFGSALTENPGTIWNLVHYVQSIVDGRNVDFGEETRIEESTVE